MEEAAEKQKRYIAAVEDERDHYLSEAQALANRVDQLLEDIRQDAGVAFTYQRELKVSKCSLVI